MSRKGSTDKHRRTTPMADHQADYSAMWELIRRKVWDAHYDLGELRGDVNKRTGRESGGSPELDSLRVEVTVMLLSAGYRRVDVADFMFISEAAVTARLRSWEKQQQPR